MFWYNLEHFSKDSEYVIKNIKLEHFSRIYNNYSLFHYFAENERVIKYVHYLYLSQLGEKMLNQREYHTPLVILKPDPQGHSALDLALMKQRIKSFELMLEMLEGFKCIMISKMMIKCMPHMV